MMVRGIIEALTRTQPLPWLKQEHPFHWHSIAYLLLESKGDAA